MDRDCFKKLLLDSTNAALAFARKFVFNRVDDNVGYVVEFNDNVNVAMKCPTLESAEHLNSASHLSLRSFNAEVLKLQEGC
jgi:hypothetical protein